ncbi:hypothetical protein V8G54_018344 [Vigna mungo]|uniref:Transmembrane protein n=1 Tax=Vigna mungo TaxID=3915 RepID=A0AAQ3RTV9_VIGMU
MLSIIWGVKTSSSGASKEEEGCGWCCTELLGSFGRGMKWSSTLVTLSEEESSEESSAWKRVGLGGDWASWPVSSCTRARNSEALVLIFMGLDMYTTLTGCGVFFFLGLVFFVGARCCTLVVRMAVSMEGCRTEFVREDNGERTWDRRNKRRDVFSGKMRESERK